MDLEPADGKDERPQKPDSDQALTPSVSLTRASRENESDASSDDVSMIVHNDSQADFLQNVNRAALPRSISAEPQETCDTLGSLGRPTISKKVSFRDDTLTTFIRQSTVDRESMHVQFDEDEERDRRREAREQRGRDSDEDTISKVSQFTMISETSIDFLSPTRAHSGSPDPPMTPMESDDEPLPDTLLVHRKDTPSVMGDTTIERVISQLTKVEETADDGFVLVEHVTMGVVPEDEDQSQTCQPHFECSTLCAKEIVEMLRQPSGRQASQCLSYFDCDSGCECEDKGVRLVKQEHFSATSTGASEQSPKHNHHVDICAPWYNCGTDCVVPAKDWRLKRFASHDGHGQSRHSALLESQQDQEEVDQPQVVRVEPEVDQVETPEALKYEVGMLEEQQNEPLTITKKCSLPAPVEPDVVLQLDAIMVRQSWYSCDKNCDMVGRRDEVKSDAMTTVLPTEVQLKPVEPSTAAAPVPVMDSAMVCQNWYECGKLCEMDERIVERIVTGSETAPTTVNVEPKPTEATTADVLVPVMDSTLVCQSWYDCGNQCEPSETEFEVATTGPENCGSKPFALDPEGPCPTLVSQAYFDCSTQCDKVESVDEGEACTALVSNVDSATVAAPVPVMDSTLVCQGWYTCGKQCENDELIVDRIGTGSETAAATTVDEPVPVLDSTMVCQSWYDCGKACEVDEETVTQQVVPLVASAPVLDSTQQCQHWYECSKQCEPAETVVDVETTVVEVGSKPFALDPEGPCPLLVSQEYFDCGSQCEKVETVDVVSNVELVAEPTPVPVMDSILVCQKWYACGKQCDKDEEVSLKVVTATETGAATLSVEPTEAVAADEPAPVMDSTLVCQSWYDCGKVCEVVHGAVDQEMATKQVVIDQRVPHQVAAPVLALDSTKQCQHWYECSKNCEPCETATRVVMVSNVDSPTVAAPVPVMDSTMVCQNWYACGKQCEKDEDVVHIMQTSVTAAEDGSKPFALDPHGPCPLLESQAYFDCGSQCDKVEKVDVVSNVELVAEPTPVPVLDSTLVCQEWYDCNKQCESVVDAAPGVDLGTATTPTPTMDSRYCQEWYKCSHHCGGASLSTCPTTIDMVPVLESTLSCQPWYECDKSCEVELRKTVSSVDGGVAAQEPVPPLDATAVCQSWYQCTKQCQTVPPVPVGRHDNLAVVVEPDLQVVPIPQAAPQEQAIHLATCQPHYECTTKCTQPEMHVPRTTLVATMMTSVEEGPPSPPPSPIENPKLNDVTTESSVKDLRELKQELTTAVTEELRLETAAGQQICGLVEVHRVRVEPEVMQNQEMDETAMVLDPGVLVAQRRTTTETTLAPVVEQKLVVEPRTEVEAELTVMKDAVELTGENRDRVYLVKVVSHGAKVDSAVAPVEPKVPAVETQQQIEVTIVTHSLIVPVPLINQEMEHTKLELTPDPPALQLEPQPITTLVTESAPTAEVTVMKEAMVLTGEDPSNVRLVEVSQSGHVDRTTRSTLVADGKVVTKTGLVLELDCSKLMCPGSCCAPEFHGGICTEFCLRTATPSPTTTTTTIATTTASTETVVELQEAPKTVEKQKVSVIEMRDALRLTGEDPNSVVVLDDKNGAVTITNVECGNGSVVHKTGANHVEVVHRRDNVTIIETTDTTTAKPAATTLSVVCEPTETMVTSATTTTHKRVDCDQVDEVLIIQRNNTTDDTMAEVRVIGGGTVVTKVRTSGEAAESTVTQVSPRVTFEDQHRVRPDSQASSDGNNVSRVVVADIPSTASRSFRRSRKEVDREIASMVAQVSDALAKTRWNRQVVKQEDMAKDGLTVVDVSQVTETNV